MSYNYSKLLGRITEKCGTQAKFAEIIGISEHTVSRKLNNHQSWTQPEIDKICRALGIPWKDIQSYFFAE